MDKFQVAKNYIKCAKYRINHFKKYGLDYNDRVAKKYLDIAENYLKTAEKYLMLGK